MKVMKRIFAAAAALIMACTMYIPVFAANDNNTLTIHSKTDGHTYQAYQVTATITRECCPILNGERASKIRMLC